MKLKVTGQGVMTKGVEYGEQPQIILLKEEKPPEREVKKPPKEEKPQLIEKPPEKEVKKPVKRKPPERVIKIVIKRRKNHWLWALLIIMTIIGGFMVVKHECTTKKEVLT